MDDLLNRIYILLIFGGFYFPDNSWQTKSHQSFVKWNNMTNLDFVFKIWFDFWFLSRSDGGEFVRLSMTSIVRNSGKMQKIK